MLGKWLLILMFVMFNVIAISEVAMCECREDVYFPLPGTQVFSITCMECTFANTAEFRNAPKPDDGWDLNIDLNKIPESEEELSTIKRLVLRESEHEVMH